MSKKSPKKERKSFEDLYNKYINVSLKELEALLKDEQKEKLSVKEHIVIRAIANYLNGNVKEFVMLKELIEDE